MVDDELKAAFAAGRRLPAAMPACEPVVVHGGGPQISAMLDRLGLDQRVQGAACGSPRPRSWTSCGWCSPGRSGASWSACSTSTARSPSACPARTPACSARAGRGAVVDGERVDLGLVGDVEQRRHRRGQAHPRRRPDPGRLDRRAGPRRRRAGAQRQRRHGGGGPRRRTRRREARGPHRRRGHLRGLARPRLAALDAHRRPSWRRCCPSVEAGMVPKLEACIRAVEGGVTAGARHRRPRAALDPARGLHRRGHRHDGRARHHRDRDQLGEEHDHRYRRRSNATLTALARR